MNRGLYSTDSPKNKKVAVKKDKKRNGDREILKDINPSKSPRNSLENFTAGTTQVPWGGLFQDNSDRKVVKSPIKQKMNLRSPKNQFSPVMSPFTNRDDTYLGAPGSCSTVQEKKKKNRRRSGSAERAPITKSKQPFLDLIREENSYNKENSYSSDFSPKRKAPPVPKTKASQFVENKTPQNNKFGHKTEGLFDYFDSPSSPTFDDLLKEYKSKLMVPSIGGVSKNRRRRSKSVDYSTQSPLSKRAEDELCPDNIRGRNWASPANRVMKVIMPAQKDKIYYFREEERKKRIVNAENLSPVAQYDKKDKKWVKSPERNIKNLKSPEKVKSPISNKRDMSPAAALSLGLSNLHTVGNAKTESTTVNLSCPETPDFEKGRYNLRSNSNVSIGSTGSGRLSFQTAVNDNKTKIQKEKTKLDVVCGLGRKSPKITKSQKPVNSTAKPYSKNPVNTIFENQPTKNYGGPDLAEVLRQQQQARKSRNQNMNKSGIYAPRSFKPKY